MSELQVPDSWLEVNPTAWTGLVLVLGGTDTGKSTAVHVFYEELRAENQSVALIDGDPGQSTIGPPTTLTAALPSETSSFPPTESLLHRFVGAPTPRGHMLEMVVGAQRLLEAIALQADVPDVVLYDTTGFIEVRRGGRALKYALIDLLRPSTIVALQREDELEPILTPLRRRPSPHLVELPVPAAVTRRSADKRRKYRADRFAAYFEEAILRTIHWPDVAVLPNLDFSVNQLVAFTSEDDFVEALGRIEAIDREACTVTVETPLQRGTGVETMRLGDVCLDPGTYADQPR